MSDDVLTPLTGPALRIEDRADLEEFLARPDAAEIVRASSFEQVFFTIRSLGLGDAVDLLAWVEPDQVRGFIDLDCWRKDSFVRRPFMEWIAAFVQTGPEDLARAMGGVDPDVVALFLKDLIDVFEIERDEPPPATELTFSPDGSLAVRLRESGDAASMASLVLDALFRYAPDLGFRVLRRVRYTTRTELEETAYVNKVRRLDVHGFVDYYEALSIYSSPESDEVFGKPAGRTSDREVIPGDTALQVLPTVFADSLSGGRFLIQALEKVARPDTGRLADELTALGNRILSANLVNMGEVGGIRLALGEMRSFLTIGLESLSGGDLESAARVLEGDHMQAVFRSGFAQVVRPGISAGRLLRLPGFSAELLESPDAEFIHGVLRSKPLVWTGAEYRGFESLGDVEEACRRAEGLATCFEGFLEIFPAPRPTLRRTFNTAVVRKALSGRFEPVALEAGELEVFIADGIAFPDLELPEALAPFARTWIGELERDLRALGDGRIDPRFVDCVHMKL